MDNLKKKIDDIINENRGIYVADRRYLHQNPELSFEEYNTSSYIKSRLEEMNISYTSGLLDTDVIAFIEGEKNTNNPEKCILIRADIDALPIDEKSDVSYKSNRDGVMHACGHDGHTAILLGVCDTLSKIKSDFGGKVKLVFQPGEETDGGADPLIKKGILDEPNVDICVALHMDPDIDTGNIRVKSGSLYASPDDFRIKVTGKGGHGAERENCVDPIEISAKIISSVLDITKNEMRSEQKAVVSFGSVQSGGTSNVIPEVAYLTGTARSLTDDVRSYLKKRIGEIANDICKLYGAECEYEFIELFPPLVNDKKVSEMLLKSAISSIGSEHCLTGGEPTMAGEDFAYFAKERPSTLFKLGCRSENKGIVNSLHNPKFDIDEDCLATGVTVFCNFVIDYLND